MIRPDQAVLPFNEEIPTLLTPSQIDDLKLASSQMTGAIRRAFQAKMTQKYCHGSARQAEKIFGWGRHTVALGLNEQRTGLICYGAQAAYGGNLLWETRHPKVAAALWQLAELYAQQEPTFRTTQTYTRLTAAEALKQLRAQGFAEEVLPAPSTMAEILNRNGYRPRKVLKAKPQKKDPKPMPSSPTFKPKTWATTAGESSA